MSSMTASDGGAAECVSVHIPRPIVAGLLSGVAISLGISAFGATPVGQGHAVFAAATATPYLVSRCWTGPDGLSWSS